MPQHELLACAQCGCFAFSCFEDFAIRANLFAKGNQVVLEGEGLGTRSENPRDGGPPGSRVQFYFAVVDKVRDGKIYNIKTYICGSELDSDGRVVRTWRGWPI